MKSFKDPLDPEVIGPEEERETKVRNRFWPTFKKAAAQLPFAEDVVAAYYCAFDPATPNRVRFLLLAALAYFVVPLDTVPDFILGLGFGDDVAVLATALAAVTGNITEAHREAARNRLQELGDDDQPDEDDRSAA
ncbi:MAG: YkvA family protein [Pseudomonadota bacterium]